MIKIEGDEWMFHLMSREEKLAIVLKLKNSPQDLTEWEIDWLYSLAEDNRFLDWAITFKLTRAKTLMTR